MRDRKRGRRRGDAALGRGGHPGRGAQPGGDLVVLLDGDRARLSGPVRKVADLLVEPRSLLAAAHT